MNHYAKGRSCCGNAHNQHNYTRQHRNSASACSSASHSVCFGQTKTHSGNTKQKTVPHCVPYVFRFFGPRLSSVDSNARKHNSADGPVKTLQSDRSTLSATLSKHAHTRRHSTVCFRLFVCFTLAYSIGGSSSGHGKVATVKRRPAQKSEKPGIDTDTCFPQMEAEIASSAAAPPTVAAALLPRTRVVAAPSGRQRRLSSCFCAGGEYAAGKIRGCARCYRVCSRVGTPLKNKTAASVQEASCGCRNRCCGSTQLLKGNFLFGRFSDGGAKV